MKRILLQGLIAFCLCLPVIGQASEKNSFDAIKLAVIRHYEIPKVLDVQDSISGLPKKIWFSYRYGMVCWSAGNGECKTSDYTADEEGTLFINPSNALKDGLWAPMKISGEWKVDKAGLAYWVPKK